LAVIGCYWLYVRMLDVRCDVCASCGGWIGWMMVRWAVAGALSLRLLPSVVWQEKICHPKIM
jgi:hypothetical protein